jgi:hypothetical protein
VKEKLPYVDNVVGDMLPRPRIALEYPNNEGIVEVLIHWESLSPADATWEILDYIQQCFPYFVLEDKDNPKEDGVLHVEMETTSKLKG